MINRSPMSSSTYDLTVRSRKGLGFSVQHLQNSARCSVAAGLSFVTDPKSLIAVSKLVRPKLVAAH